MKLSAILSASVIGAAVAQDYYAPGYTPPTEAYVPPQPEYVNPYGHYTAAPARSYEEESKDHFDQFWKNQELCSAEYDLTSCLLNSYSRKEFFEQKRLSHCIVQFVEGLCGDVTFTAEETEAPDAYAPRNIDNGKIVLTAENCETAAFADSYLVLNKMIADLNSVLALSPSFDSWTFANIQMAVKATRNNADCAITSFFNFLNQCASSQFISSDDIQCVEATLADESCGYAEEDVDGWNLPLLIERYGFAGADEAIEKMKKAYGTDNIDDIIPALREVSASIADEGSQGIKYVKTSYDYHSKASSLDVCPQNFLSMNGLFEDYDDEGLPVEDVAFHFPINATATSGDDTVPLDPITDPKTIHHTCAAFFKATKEVFDRTNDETHFGDRCFSINSYQIDFVESGASKTLYYKEIPAALAGKDKCYTASWDQNVGCTSHLAKVSMSVACCKSYATIHKELSPEPTKAPYYETPRPTEIYYLEDTEYVPPPTEAYTTAPPAYTTAAPYYATAPPAPYYTTPVPKEIKTITKDMLLFEHTVTSRSDRGSLANIGNTESPPSTVPDLVFAAADQLNRRILRQCSKFDLEAFEYYGVGKRIRKVCAQAEHVAEAIEAQETDDNDDDDEVITALLEDGATAPPAYYATTAPPAYYATQAPAVHYYVETPAPELEVRLRYHPYYVSETKAAVEICETLKIDLDFAEIIPLVSNQCFPQACIMSQLASCMEIPEQEYENYGYDYVAKPYAEAKKYDGYAAPTEAYVAPTSGYAAPAPPSYYTLLATAEATPSTIAAFATAGFVAGVAVIAVVNAVIASRRQESELL